MKDQIRSALAGQDYALAQTLADDWLRREPNVPAAHYFAALARDAQGSEADALVHYEKALELGLSGKNLRGRCLAPGARIGISGNSPVQRRYFGEASKRMAMSRSSRLFLP